MQTVMDGFVHFMHANLGDAWAWYVEFFVWMAAWRLAFELVTPHLIYLRWGTTRDSHKSHREWTLWKSRTISDVHAFVACALSARMFYSAWDEAGSFRAWFDHAKVAPYCSSPDFSDRAQLPHSGGMTLLAASGSYFLVDFYDCWRTNDVSFGIALHHVHGLVACILSSVTGVGQFYGIALAITELTTPFINRHWYYCQVPSLKASRAFVVNGVVMIVMWFFVRVLTMPLFLRCALLDFHLMKAISPVTAYVISYGIVAVELLNLFWFGKLLKGAFKHVLGGGSKTKNGKGSKANESAASTAKGTSKKMN